MTNPFHCGHDFIGNSPGCSIGSTIGEHVGEDVHSDASLDYVPHGFLERMLRGGGAYAHREGAGEARTTRLQTQRHEQESGPAHEEGVRGGAGTAGGQNLPL